ncbi:hypothetical protein XELAEV_18019421mg [Xenopus laevis]|uniref:Olfactory receptor n=1 Tax=Xenopus laevis TaxID=8355 RepID=A0A974DF25_XENLA|nr:hypothetical protein XELAEV_18019421mg [Xenopus laevis]
MDGIRHNLEMGNFTICISKHINQTKITEFFLLGLNVPQTMKTALFVILLVLYAMTLSGNSLIIALYLASHSLHSPMYFFLSHLAASDILLTTSVVPNLLCTLLNKGKIMSVPSCLFQFFASGSFTVADSFLLTVMSFDRYIAICNALRYGSIMNLKFCFYLVTWSWLLSLLVCTTEVFLMAHSEFCGCNIIDFIYCDFSPLLELSCEDTFIVEILTMMLSVLVVLAPFFFIMSTYVIIILSILRISSSTGRQKAFSTCSSHLTVVCTYYGTLFSKYTVPPKGQSLSVNKAISLLYTVATPLINPIVYSFRNQDILSCLQNLISILVEH